MSYLAKAGSFNVDTTKTLGQTQSIGSIGFQPKIVMFFWGGSIDVEDSVSGGNINHGFGAATDSTHRFCVANMAQDALDVTDVISSDKTTEIFRAYTSATGTLDGILDFASMDSDGFTLTIDDQFANDYRVSYLALGGEDLTNTYIGYRELSGSSGSYSVSGVGFQPDMLLSVTEYMARDTENSMINFTIGIATASDAQGNIWVYELENQDTSYNCGHGNSDDIHNTPDSAIVESFVNFTSDGFIVSSESGANEECAHFICLKGGQYVVGDLLTRTDGNDITEIFGFQPSAILFASVNRAESIENEYSQPASASIGAATSTSNRTAAAIWDASGVANSQTARANYDSVVYINIDNDAVVGLMDLKSINTNGFTCVMDDADPSACWVMYLAIGESITGNREALTSDTAAVLDSIRYYQDTATVLDTVNVSITSGAFGDINVTEQITAIDTAEAITGTIVCDVSDTCTATDTISVQNPQLPVLCQSTITVTDTVLAITGEPIVNVSETIVATDTVDLRGGELPVSVIDITNATDTPILRYDISTIVSDAISTTDSISMCLESFIDTSDTATVSDTPTIYVGIEIQVSSTISATDDPDVSPESPGALHVSDVISTASVSDSVIALVGDPPVSVQDDAITTDAVIVNYQISPDVLDSVTTLDTCQLIAGDNSVLLSDSADVSDIPTVAIDLVIDVLDSSTSTDILEIQTTILYLSVLDSCGALDQPDLGGALSIPVSDTVTVLDTCDLVTSEAIVTVQDISSTSDLVEIYLVIEILVSETTSSLDSCNLYSNCSIDVVDSVTVTDTILIENSSCYADVVDISTVSDSGTCSPVQEALGVTIDPSNPEYMRPGIVVEG